ncbi:hypothetical protein FRC19_006844, partial [Serendipita sp. 401]
SRFVGVIRSTEQIYARCTLEWTRKGEEGTDHGGMTCRRRQQGIGRGAVYFVLLMVMVVMMKNVMAMMTMVFSTGSIAVEEAGAEERDEFQDGWATLRIQRKREGGDRRQ